MNLNLIEYLKETVNKYPNKIAIDDNEDSISFLELDNISDKIASKIYFKNNILRSPVAVFMPKNRLAVASFISVFKSGNFYVPLDTKSPLERISKILDTLNASCIITDLDHKEKLISIGFKGEIIVFEEVVSTSLSKDDTENLKPVAGRSDVASISAEAFASALA